MTLRRCGAILLGVLLLSLVSCGGCGGGDAAGVANPSSETQPASNVLEPADLAVKTAVSSILGATETALKGAMDFTSTNLPVLAFRAGPELRVTIPNTKGSSTLVSQGEILNDSVVLRVTRSNDRIHLFWTARVDGHYRIQYVPLEISETGFPQLQGDIRLLASDARGLRVVVDRSTDDLYAAWHEGEPFVAKLDRYGKIQWTERVDNTTVEDAGESVTLALIDSRPWLLYSIACSNGSAVQCAERTETGWTGHPVGKFMPGASVRKLRLIPPILGTTFYVAYIESYPWGEYLRVASSASAYSIYPRFTPQILASTYWDSTFQDYAVAFDEKREQVHLAYLYREKWYGAPAVWKVFRSRFSATLDVFYSWNVPLSTGADPDFLYLFVDSATGTATTVWKAGDSDAGIVGETAREPSVAVTGANSFLLGFFEDSNLRFWRPVSGVYPSISAGPAKEMSNLVLSPIPQTSDVLAVWSEGSPTNLDLYAIRVK